MFLELIGLLLTILNYFCCKQINESILGGFLNWGEVYSGVRDRKVGLRVFKEVELIEFGERLNLGLKEKKDLKLIFF